MHSTHIFLDPDFCSRSIYRSIKADKKKADWCAWAEDNLTDKRKKEIERAMRKQGRGRL